MIKSFKSFIFNIFKKLGSESIYLIILFKVRIILRIRSSTELKLIQFYSKLIGDSCELIFDIGSNVGVRTSVFSQLSSQVIAVEPNIKLVQILKSRFRNTNVKIINKACSDTNIAQELFIGENHLVSTISKDFMNHKIDAGENAVWNKSEIVNSVTLDQLIIEYGVPEFCKIDVEGFEKRVLKGLNVKVGMLSFEFTFPTFINDSIWCIGKLSKLGYREFNISYGESLFFCFKEWISEDEIVNFLMQDYNENLTTYGDIYAK